MFSDRRWLGWLSFALVLGYGVVAWWPFAFRPRNQVNWLPDRAGLQFATDGIACDSEPLPPLGTNQAGQAANFTVELWVEAERESNSDVFHLLTIHDDRLPSNFVLCQWKRGIVLRVPSRNLLTRGRREVGADGALPARQTRFITVSGSGAGTVIYLDGVVAGQFPQFVVSAEALKGRLILGNAANGKHSWSGRLFGMAMYNRTLDAAEVARHHVLWSQANARQLVSAAGLLALYLFDEGSGQVAQDHSRHRHQMAIPAIYHAPHKEFLTLPWRELVGDKPNYRDMIVNVLGFVPFGFCYFLHRRLSARHPLVADALFAVLAGATVSLILETVQVWLGNRVSSATDLLCNTVGALAGVLLACVVRIKVTNKASGSRQP